jgi:hypothetical protein
MSRKRRMWSGLFPNPNETVLHLFDELATFKSPRSQPSRPITKE